MKKLLVLILAVAMLGGALFLGIVPGSPRPGECSNFHPHTDEFGGGEVVLKVLDWLVQTGNFNAWTLNGRTLVQFVFNGKPAIIIYGTGNPTMFIPDKGTDYVRSQTNGMNKINGQKGLETVKGHLGNCLRTSYAASFAPAAQPASIPVAVPNESTKAIALLSGLGVMVIVLAKLFIGGNRQGVIAK